MAIGTARLSAVDFSGLILVDSHGDNDFVGFVFSFQDTNNFYVVYASNNEKFKNGTEWNQGPWKIVRVESTDLSQLEGMILI